MMRRPLTTLILMLTCGVLLLGAGLAVAIESGVGPRVARSGAHDEAVGAAARLSTTSSWPVRMSAAPNDLTLAEASFREPRSGQRISGSSLRVNVGSPFGGDYLVAATLQSHTKGVLSVLAVLVNRPSPLLDPVAVTVGLIAPRALAAPQVLESADPLSRSADARTPALCDLPVHGSALGASQLRALRTPSPVPSPTPPVGKVPGEGCVPTPGYACPAAFGGGSRAVVLVGWGPAASGAH